MLFKFLGAYLGFSGQVIRGWVFQLDRAVLCDHLGSLRTYRMFGPPTVSNIDTLNTKQAVNFAKSRDDFGGKNGAS
jgi:hypothetical protein